MTLIADLGNPRLSVVVPCYNEVPNLDELHRRVRAVCVAQVGSSYEVVLVNDGSKDETWTKIVALANDDPHVVGVNLARNYGHQLALSAGLELCRGDRTLVLDADLQDPPELLPELMAKMDHGYDVVYGQRMARGGETWFKRASAALFYRLLARLVDVPIPKDTGDFRLINRRALDHLNAMPERYRFIRGMVSWIGLRQAPLPYQREPRFAGETHYPFRKMLGLALDAMTSFSVVPLRAASHIGIAVGMCGFLALGYAMFSWIRGDVVPGWTSLVAIILILGSIQLMVIGIFGEYLGRLYMESKGRPLFIVDCIVRNEQAPADGDLPVGKLRSQIREAVVGRG